jgi:hypothetical protein
MTPFSRQITRISIDFGVIENSNRTNPNRINNFDGEQSGGKPGAAENPLPKRFGSSKT